MKNLNRIRPRPSHLIVYQGHALLITDLKGFICGGTEGFYSGRNPGCFYAAKQRMGSPAFASLGEEQRAANLLAGAERLKRRFNETFWMPDEQYFALALDPGKKASQEHRCRSRAGSRLWDCR
jgi:hypothetical protein